MDTSLRPSVLQIILYEPIGDENVSAKAERTRSGVIGTGPGMTVVKVEVGLIGQ
jgi:hypothetical protein